MKHDNNTLMRQRSQCNECECECEGGERWRHFEWIKLDRFLKCVCWRVNVAYALKLNKIDSILQRQQEHHHLHHTHYPSTMWILHLGGASPNRSGIIIRTRKRKEVTCVLYSQMNGNTHTHTVAIFVWLINMLITNLTPKLQYSGRSFEAAATTTITPSIYISRRQYSGLSEKSTLTNRMSIGWQGKKILVQFFLNEITPNHQKWVKTKIFKSTQKSY